MAVHQVEKEGKGTSEIGNMQRPKGGNHCILQHGLYSWSKDPVSMTPEVTE